MKTNLLYLTIVVLLLTSCGGGKKKSAFTPTSSGRPYELIVVINEELWERPAGRALFNVLDSDMPGLPQSERVFRLMHTEPVHFSMTLKLLRNIIMVDIQDIYTQPKFKVASDVYAEPQAVLTIQAPNEEEFQAYVEENGQTIIDYFTRAEMNRQMRMLEKEHSNLISTKVKEMFGYEVWVPGELTSTKTGEDFLWASTKAATSDMNFVIYSYPYTDERTFTREFQMQKRDSVMRVNIPGAQEGMYMATDTLTVATKAITVQNEFALEARGLWKMKGDFMGGPFVSHSRVDKANKRVVTVEAFIYSPDKLKRNLVRLMEASLYTLRFNPDSEGTTDNNTIAE